MELGEGEFIMLQCDDKPCFDNQLKAVLCKQGLRTDALKSHQPPSLMCDGPTHSDRIGFLRFSSIKR